MFLRLAPISCAFASGPFRHFVGGYFNGASVFQPRKVAWDWLSLLVIPSSFTVKDLRHLLCVRHLARIADFDGEQGRENGHIESVCAVSPGNV